VPDEDYFSSSSTSLPASLRSSPEISPASSPLPRSPEPTNDNDDDLTPAVDYSLPVPFVGTPFVNQEEHFQFESLVPDSERGEYWPEDATALSPSSQNNASTLESHRSMVSAVRSDFSNDGEVQQAAAPAEPRVPRKYASETVVSAMVEDDDNLSDEEIQQLYPDLGTEGGDEDSEDDGWEQQFDWTIHDSDIQDFFQPEWSETDMLEQQDFVSFLQILGLEGEEAEGIRCVFLFCLVWFFSGFGFALFGFCLGF